MVDVLVILMYADDLVIMSPSVAGLYKLIHICESFGLSHDVFPFFNKKSTIMSFRAGNLKDLCPIAFVGPIP